MMTTDTSTYLFGHVDIISREIGHWDLSILWPVLAIKS